MPAHPAVEILPDHSLARVAQVQLQKPFSARPPGSKSLTNRLLILAALTGQPIIITDWLDSEDTEVTRIALRQLGVKIEEQPHDTWLIDGSGLTAPTTPPTLYLANAGTAMRFLTAVLCARGISCTLDGTARMRERPMYDLLQSLQDLGGDVRSQLGNGCPPIIIGPGGLTGGETQMSGQVSSQFFSAIMLAAPLAKSDVRINIKDELLSRPYVEMTRRQMKQFNVDVDLTEQFVHIRAPQRYVGSGGYSKDHMDWTGFSVEADASAATYPLGLGVLHGVPKVTVNGFWPESPQGDIQFSSYLERFGYQSHDVYFGAHQWITKSSDIEERSDYSIDLREIPDAAMTLVTLLAVVPGHSSLTGLRNLAFKECDRLSALEEELGSLGAKVRVREDRDGFEIDGVPAESLRATRPLRTYKDHRMAMCLAILGTVVPGGVEIEDPRCVEKTYPLFWQDLAAWIAEGS